MRAAAAQRELLVKFKVLKFLGKGSYGSVFQVQRLDDSQSYALKEMDVRAMSQVEREDAVNEVRLLASVNHPNVISYNEAFLDGNRLCIIMEYAPDGDLTKVIKKWQAMRRPMPEDLIWRYAIQVARGVAALHSMRILHRDIKPGNIMIMAGDIAKIGDLGIAKLLKNTIAAKTQIGTPHYMPPEIWKNRPYGFASDSWALGCLVYEMATFKVPFEARSMNELRYKVMKGTYPPIPSSYSRDLQQLVRECLDPAPEKRPSMDGILASSAVMSRMHLLDTAPMQPPPTAGSALIDTIKVPRGNFGAIKGKLPPANYASSNILTSSSDEQAAPAPAQYKSAEVLEVQRLPQALPQLARPQPQQRQPLPPPQPQMAPQQQQQPPRLPQGLLPRVPGASKAYNGALPQVQVGMAGNRPPRLEPATPSSVAPSQAARNMWYPGRAVGSGVSATPVSESHAAYGAFYHVSPSAAAQAAVRPKVYEDPRIGGNREYNRDYDREYYNQGGGRPNNAYYNPYADRRAEAYQAKPRVQLPAIPAQRQAEQPPWQGGAGNRPPPWNYGAQGNARAAGLAYAAQLRAQAQAAAAAGENLGGRGGGGINRYPPPQWAARPAMY